MKKLFKTLSKILFGATLIIGGLFSVYFFELDKKGIEKFEPKFREFQEKYRDKKGLNV